MTEASVAPERLVLIAVDDSQIALDAFKCKLRLIILLHNFDRIQILADEKLSVGYKTVAYFACHSNAMLLSMSSELFKVVLA